MDKVKIAKKIEAIEFILSELKIDLDIRDNGSELGYVASKIINKKKRKEGPAKWIDDLVISGFFDNYRIATDVFDEFRKQVLSADMPTIRKELARAVKKKILIRDGKGVLHNPWKYKRR